MSANSKTQLKTLYGSSGSQFPDNTTGLITELIMRTFGENLVDSLWNKVDDLQLTTTATGTDTYAVTGGITAYTSGFGIIVKFTNANTGAATLNVNSLGAKSIVKNGATALSAGDIAAGQILLLFYDGTNFQVVGGGGSGSGGGTWGSITGTVTDQTDLVTYVASQISAAVAGLLDLRGAYDASGNAYPSSGGSGTAGAILKADAWVISVAGTLPTGRIVSPGDVLFAIIDTPGSTSANWAIIENNLTFTPVNKAGDTMSGDLAMGSNKVTGLGAASANGDAVRYEQIVGVQDLYIPASAMWPRTTNGCSALTKSEMATSLVNIQTLDFDQTTQEFAQFTIVLPRKYNNGTITAVVYWTASSGSGDVQWGISGGAYSNDDALTVALGTAQTVDDTLIATNDLHITSATSAITLAGTPADADFLAFQISRNPASDTLSGDAKLLGVSLRITTDAAIDA